MIEVRDKPVSFHASDLLHCWKPGNETQEKECAAASVMGTAGLEIGAEELEEGREKEGKKEGIKE